THACHFRHALALDEDRVLFLPEYFSQVNAHTAMHGKDYKHNGMALGDIKEVWFGGAHIDVFVVAQYSLLACPY
ncbi:hypothetical protein HYDPIDRAFT_99800, partial [Hydnomerulius pinastri MD-312]